MPSEVGPAAAAPKAVRSSRMMQAARAGARLARRARPLHASSSVFAETPVCGSGACATPRACASDASSANRDIAFKPAASGWGYSKAAAANWDRIFGPKKNSGAAEGAAAPGSAAQGGPTAQQSGAADGAPAGAAA